MNKYKALMLDLDGTTIPNNIDGMPSEKVQEAIGEASKVVFVGIATARPFFMVSKVLDKLELSSPLIINSGAEIIDSKTRKTLYEQLMRVEDVVNLCKLFNKLKVNFVIHDQEKDISFTDGYIPSRPSHMYIPDLTTESVEILIRKIGNIPTLAIYKTVSWSVGKINLTISHAFATKQHGIYEVSKLLKINTNEIIGVGDGYNDFPLLMACGLKVAMGNAVPELKEIADYIAPSVDEDGVAEVINKFILNP